MAGLVAQALLLAGVSVASTAMTTASIGLGVGTRQIAGTVAGTAAVAAAAALGVSTAVGPAQIVATAEATKTVALRLALPTHMAGLWSVTWSLSCAAPWWCL